MSEQPTHISETIPAEFNPSKFQETLMRPFGPDSIKTRKGHFGQELSYVEGHEYIRRLLEKPVYVHRIVRYFIKAMTFVPVFVDSEGKKGRSDDYKPFYFADGERNAVASILNSSLFYWFWRSFSDGFHCGYNDVYLFPYKEIRTPQLPVAQNFLLSKRTATIF
ncbi:MAG: hypothetical protein GX444_20725 [Myxococcales bacterium]|nr:hypothetical protein [Myxococcales bacterium]